MEPCSPVLALAPRLATVMALGGSWATLPDQHVLSEHIASETGAVLVYKLERVQFLDFFLNDYEDDDGEIRAKGVSCNAWWRGLGPP